PSLSASKATRGSRTSFAATGRRNENNYVLSTEFDRRPCLGARRYGGGRAAVPLGEPGRPADDRPALAERAPHEQHQRADVRDARQPREKAGDRPGAGHGVPAG